MPPTDSILLDPCTAFSCQNHPDLPGGYRLDQAKREGERVVLHLSKDETLQFVLHVVPRDTSPPHTLAVEDIAFDTKECPTEVPAGELQTLVTELSHRYKTLRTTQPDHGLYTATINPETTGPEWSLTQDVLPFSLLVVLVILAVLTGLNLRKRPFFHALSHSLATLLQYVVILVLCLVSGEIALRLIDYDPTERTDLYHKNGSYHFSERQGEKGQDLHRELIKETVDGIDFWTIRDSEMDVNGQLEYSFAPLTKPGEERLLGIGDSIMFGSGVKSHQTFLSALQRLGRKNGMRLDCLNVSMPGWNLPQYRIAAQKYIEATKPEIVLLGLHNGDVVPVKLSGHRTINANLLVADPTVISDGLPLQKEDARWLGRYSLLARTMGHWISRGRVPRSYRLIGKKELLVRELDRIDALCTKNHVKLALAWMPPMHRPFGEQIDHPSWMEDVWSDVQEWQKSHPNVLLIDPRPAMRDTPPESIRLDLCCHLNRKGHVLMGDILFNSFVQAGWLKKTEHSSQQTE